MGRFSVFNLPLKGIPVGTQKFEYRLGTDFFRNMESPDIVKGDVDVELTVTHTGEVYHLEFACKGMIYLLCDRCLDEMEWPVDATYHLDVKYGETYSDENDELLIIPESDNFLNVAYMIYDTISLTIPLKHVHPLGKCNRAMSAQLKKHSARPAFDEGEDGDNSGDDFPEDIMEEIDDITSEENSDPRWDALKDIKENN